MIHAEEMVAALRIATHFSIKVTLFDIPKYELAFLTPHLTLVLEILELNKKLTRAIPTSVTDKQYLLEEQYESSSSYVLTFGTCLHIQSDNTRLQSSRITLFLKSPTINGRMHLLRDKDGWEIQFEILNPIDVNYSALTGLRNDSAPTTSWGQFVLWLEWENYYTQSNAIPELITKKGIVVDSNLFAQTYGVQVGMKTQLALPLLPQCKVNEITSPHEKREIWLSALTDFTHTIQPLAPHKAILDLSAHPNPYDITSHLVKKLIELNMGHLKYGVGPSIWIAQLAALSNNPFQFCENTRSKLATLSIDKLLVLTPNELSSLYTLGFKSIADVQNVDRTILFEHLGERAIYIQNASLGIVIDKVSADYPPINLVESYTFDTSVDDRNIILNILSKLTKNITQNLLGKQFTSITLQIHTSNGKVLSQSRSTSRAIHDFDRLRTHLVILFDLLTIQPEPIDSIKIIIDDITPINTVQQNLFISAELNHTHKTVSQINSIYGENKILLAKQIEIARRERMLKAWRNATGWR